LRQKKIAHIPQIFINLASESRVSRSGPRIKRDAKYRASMARLDDISRNEPPDIAICELWDTKSDEKLS
jgi:hypothetical protein